MGRWGCLRLGSRWGLVTLHSMGKGWCQQCKGTHTATLLHPLPANVNVGAPHPPRRCKGTMAAPSHHLKQEDWKGQCCPSPMALQVWGRIRKSQQSIQQLQVRPQPPPPHTVHTPAGIQSNLQPSLWWSRAHAPTSRASLFHSLSKWPCCAMVHGRSTPHGFSTRVTGTSHTVHRLPGPLTSTSPAS